MARTSGSGPGAGRQVLIVIREIFMPILRLWYATPAGVAHISIRDVTWQCG